MNIIIENCSSPGAHFSKNTNEVLLKINNWIAKNNSPELPFIDFRKRVAKEENINDNNARNIYPLLKNGGLVEYHAGDSLKTDSFFTKRGLAYIKALETKKLIDNSDYTKRQKEEACKQVDEILSSIICDTLERLLKNNELNYSEGLKWYLMFLARYQKINRQEFAAMIYTMNKDQDDWQNVLDGVIQDYRNNNIEIEVQVRVRNDQKIIQQTGNTTRLEGISFLTAYNYYSSLVLQAGLINKIEGYYVVVDDKSDKLVTMLEEE